MEEGKANGEEMFVQDQDAAELTEQGVGALDLSPPFVAPQFSAVFI